MSAQLVDRDGEKQEGSSPPGCPLNASPAVQSYSALGSLQHRAEDLRTHRSLSNSPSELGCCWLPHTLVSPLGSAAAAPVRELWAVGVVDSLGPTATARGGLWRLPSRVDYGETLERSCAHFSLFRFRQRASYFAESEHMRRTMLMQTALIGTFPTETGRRESFMFLGRINRHVSCRHCQLPEGP